MNRMLIILSLVTALVCYLLFAHTDLVIRGVCFLVSIVLAFMAYCFFDHAVRYRKKWMRFSGKRATPPKESLVTGLVLLALALASMIYCFRR